MENIQSKEYDFCLSYFTKDEYILWQGKPEGKNNLEIGGTVPFGVFFLGFGVVWVIVSLFFWQWMALLGIPFIAVGLYFLIFREIIRNDSRYVITNKKIYRKQLGKIKFMDMLSLPPMRIERMDDGRGSIYFGERDEYSDGERTPLGMTFSIECVPDVNSVYKIIKDTTKNY